MRYTLRTLLPPAALAAVCAVTLAACGGGDGGGGEPTNPQSPDPAVTDPSPYSAGPYAINGIDRIPQSMVKLTRQQMQRKFVIGDYDEEHAQQVGTIACQSYIQSGDCGNHAGRLISNGAIRTETGSSPFTKIVSLVGGDTGSLAAVREIAKMPEVKIVVWTGGPNDAHRRVSNSYLTIHSIGNQWGDDISLDDLPLSSENRTKIVAAIREHRLIYVAGWIKDANGNYIRHPGSVSCRGDDIREGCVWTRFDFHYGGGTSYSAPQFAAALASVLAVAPDTTPENLAKLGKACVKRRGEGIEELLRVSGGLGVADFACISDIVSAMANLPDGGRTNVTVNGQRVTLSAREIVLPSAGMPANALPSE